MVIRNDLSLFNCVNMELLSTDGIQRNQTTERNPSECFLQERTLTGVLTHGAGWRDSGKTGQCVSFNRQYLYSLSEVPCFFPKNLLWKAQGTCTSPHLFSKILLVSCVQLAPDQGWTTTLPPFRGSFIASFGTPSKTRHRLYVAMVFGQAGRPVH